MGIDKINFRINESENIIINLPCLLKDLFRYDEAIAVYMNKNGQEYIIYQGVIIQGLRSLNYILKAALLGKLALHESIRQDIGYLWNQYYRDEKIALVYATTNEGLKYWIGQNYNLWSTPANQVPCIETWLYEKEGQIFLEITPDYQWNGMPLKEARKDKNYISYKEFIKNYKPFVITALDRKIAEQWLKEIERLVPLIEANDDKYSIKQPEGH